MKGNEIVPELIRRIELLYWEAYERDHHQSVFEMANSNAKLFASLLDYFQRTKDNYDE